MIYIIDDKKSRQKDFGWDKARFETFSNSITPIESVEGLRKLQESILQTGNTILFHESFYASDDEKQAVIDAFKQSLKDNSERLYVAYFSGSKGGRYVKDNICMLPPDVLYSNLEVFINRIGEHNFKYLAFGENFEIEESLRRRLDRINDDNIGGEKISVSNNVFFATTSDDLEVEPPFDNVDVKHDWDLPLLDSVITDQKLDSLVNDWFNETKYDLIYIPLCFGKTLSDFMGLRLAMHIRLTPTLNQTTPVFVYGVATYNEIKQNYCFDILKTSTVRLIDCDNDSLKRASQLEIPNCDLAQEVGLIHLETPSNIGGHSLANQWGVDVLNRVTFNQELNNTEIIAAKKSLYFKFVFSKTLYSKEKNGRKESTDTKIQPISSAGKRILLIDDEANNGWDLVLKRMFNGAAFNVIQERVSDYNNLSEKSRREIEKGDYDLFFLDLRMNGVEEEDNLKPEEFSGLKILKEIKKQNKGNQVIILTASNKAWNMKALIDAGADGYYIKESPDYAFPPEYSLSNAHKLVDSINSCLNKNYLREIYRIIQHLKALIKTANSFEGKTDGILANIDIAFDLLAKSSCNEKYKAYSYLQLFLTIEEYVKTPTVIDITDSGLYLYNKDERYRILKDKQQNDRTVIYDSILTMNNGHYIIKKGKYTGRFIDTNFLVSSLLIFKFGKENSSVKNWTKVYKTRNSKVAHPERANVSIDDIYQLLNFLEYFFDSKNENWRSPNEAFPDISKEDQLKMLLEKFNHK